MDVGHDGFTTLQDGETNWLHTPQRRRQIEQHCGADPSDGSGDVGRVVRRTERAPENAKPEARGGTAYRRVA